MFAPPTLGDKIFRCFSWVLGHVLQGHKNIQRIERVGCKTFRLKTIFFRVLFFCSINGCSNKPSKILKQTTAIYETVFVSVKAVANSWLLEGWISPRCWGDDSSSVGQWLTTTFCTGLSPAFKHVDVDVWHHTLTLRVRKFSEGWQM